MTVFSQAGLEYAFSYCHGGQVEHGGRFIVCMSVLLVGRFGAKKSISVRLNYILGQIVRNPFYMTYMFDNIIHKGCGLFLNV